ncbi:MAG: alanine--tRNA ligase [Proteobacteria bacterium]|jgi:alanyl-tRNA synthetase|nr:alanine--tRNA ligase [Pseudomonadota bacterium]MDB4827128.1 alanine--tRNA ligase [Gammaproteobacteria bacterium]MBT5188738.1 alanine--tRNA ligase [Pseudomonadota bacterium]MBT5624057.1 alanine--tRNA ligase [Pseudomonadota bacterium]MBT6071176.1 alanine--tRNA ligase [Pseudomonadota bacterium]
MKTRDIRQKFLDYFAANGHEIVSSSPLVPNNDPTLLFTNAGMVQFKDVFLGHEKRSYNRAVTAQRCVRAGGKHNDLDNVGYTARHHTFFEMLGNFSFGDYFKREAIQHAWTLLTEGYGLSPEKLWVTVYEEDDEAADIWLNEIGVPQERFARIGASDNFWSMGDTGPCGPCSEIFYDHGPEVAGGPPGTPEADGDRYVEIWNLVFMQFNRDAGGIDTPLPRPSVDTGMGLERLAAVLQGVHSNYETDLFVALIKAAGEVTGCKDLNQTSLRVIADHIRSSAFLITDGVLPSNEGRGYVLRRIIRRAIRHGYQVGATEPFMHKLVAPLIAEMGEACPELVEAEARVQEALALEGERFAQTLVQGIRILEHELEDLSGKIIPGDLAFRLYDTFGFPADLTADYARERGLSVDMPGFEQAMEAQRERARAASQFQMDGIASVAIDERTPFTGYESLNGGSKILALVSNDIEVDFLATDAEGLIVLDETPFYAESGGQVGDLGRISWSGGEFQVTDVRYLAHKVIAHFGRVVSGAPKLGDSAECVVDSSNRLATAANHSATHLLHSALREVLGDHVQQKGSMVNAEHLRFDFSHGEAVSSADIDKIEGIVNHQIRINSDVNTRVMNIDDAREEGAAALFGERYEDDVRVVGMGEFSLELCGGTHVSRTGDIGAFRLIAESGIAAGVRRLEALTGEAARMYGVNESDTLSRISTLLKTGRSDVEDRAVSLVGRVRELERKIEQLQGQLATGGSGQDPVAEAVDVNGVKLLIKRYDDTEIKGLRTILDRLRDRVTSGIIVIGGAKDGKASLLVSVSKDLVDRYNAGKLVSALAAMVGGKGGGRPDSAQGGGPDVGAIDDALAAAQEWISSQS